MTNDRTPDMDRLASSARGMRLPIGGYDHGYDDHYASDVVSDAELMDVYNEGHRTGYSKGRRNGLFYGLALFLVVAVAALLVWSLVLQDDDGNDTAQASTAADELPACDSLIGQPTDDVRAVFDTTGCMVDGAITFVMTAFYDCTDGSRLSWNDYGWGISGGTWTAHERPDGQLVPPDDMTSQCQA